MDDSVWLVTVDDNGEVAYYLCDDTRALMDLVYQHGLGIADKCCEGTVWSADGVTVEAEESTWERCDAVGAEIWAR